MQPPSDLNHWPEADLQILKACPVCGSTHSSLVHEEVRDWAFYAAPGSWSYWRCEDCDSLYLNPRPSPASIGRAYSDYYTHAGAATGLGWRRLKSRWKNERLSARWARNIEPRLHLPKPLASLVSKRATRMELPFGWQELANFKPGDLMDVGCGAAKPRPACPAHCTNETNLPTRREIHFPEGGNSTSEPGATDAENAESWQHTENQV